MIAEHIGARSDQGPFRSANQDTYWVSSTADPLELGELYIVADGVGGQEHGAAAARLAVQIISEQFYYLCGDGRSVPESLSQSIHQANVAIYEQAQERGGIKMGCTIVAAVLHKKTVYIAHVGDARLYFLHKNKLQQLTRDDSWVQKQLDAGIITPEEAETHRFRNVVTQVLGNKLDILVHQSQWDGVHRQDRLLLCSDGLHGVLDNARLAALLQSNPPQAADDLVQAAIAAGTQDNVTAVVVQLDKKGGGGGGRPAIPLWAIVTLITLFLFFAAWGGRIVWSSYVADDGVMGTDGRNGDIFPTLQPTAEPPVDRQPTETVSIPPTSSPIPPTRTALPPTAVSPTETPLPPTIVLSPPPPLILRGEIVGGIVYLWTDEQIRSTSCDQVSQASLSSGTIVHIVESDSVEINGPDNGCKLNRLIKIQSEDDPDRIGWVLTINVKPLSSDN